VGAIDDLTLIAPVLGSALSAVGLGLSLGRRPRDWVGALLCAVTVIPGLAYWLLIIVLLISIAQGPG
jgi:hypothetical protein